MSDPNLDIHVLLFHAVVVDPVEFVPSKLKIKTKNAAVKKHLESSRLLKWRTKGRALYLAANDATWRWVGENLDAPLPKTQAVFSILTNLRGKFASYLKAKDVRLLDVFSASATQTGSSPARPESLAPVAPTSAPRGESPAPAEALASFDTLADQVRQAYLHVSGGQFDVRVRLRDLRPLLEKLSRAEQDHTLLRMQSEGWLVLYPNDDPLDRDAADEAAAMVVGDRHRDLVYLHSECRS